MFNGCSSLAEIKVGFINWHIEDIWEETTIPCTLNWLSGVAPKGTFICPKQLPKEVGVDRIPEGWKIIKN